MGKKKLISDIVQLKKHFIEVCKNKTKQLNIQQTHGHILREKNKFSFKVYSF